MWAHTHTHTYRVTFKVYESSLMPVLPYCMTNAARESLFLLAQSPRAELIGCHHGSSHSRAHMYAHTHTHTHVRGMIKI